MTWAIFFAGRDDLLAVLEFVYAETDCQVREAYSAPDCDPREFPTLETIRALPELGSWPGGPHRALWSPTVSAPPVVQLVELRPNAASGHTHRFTVVGCQWTRPNVAFCDDTHSSRARMNRRRFLGAAAAYLQMRRLEESGGRYTPLRRTTRFWADAARYAASPRSLTRGCHAVGP